MHTNSTQINYETITNKKIICKFVNLPIWTLEEQDQKLNLVLGNCDSRLVGLFVFPFSPSKVIWIINYYSFLDLLGIVQFLKNRKKDHQLIREGAIKKMPYFIHTKKRIRVLVTKGATTSILHVCTFYSALWTLGEPFLWIWWFVLSKLGVVAWLSKRMSSMT